jgi:hypothetical protein
MQPHGALAAAGKLLICELDQRTFTEYLEIQWQNGRVDTVEQTLAMLDRDFGLVASRGMGAHWMEMFDKWYREPVVQAAMGRHMAAYRKLPKLPRGSTPADVCVVSDLRSPLYVRLNEGDGIHPWLLPELLRRLPEAGFAWQQVLVDDLLVPGRIPSHGFYIMTNVLVLSPEQRRGLNRRFEREGAAVLWLYAPGAFEPEKPAGAANVEATTGFRMRMSLDKTPMRCTVEPAWGGGRAEVAAAVGPWFLPVADAGCEVLARGQDGEATAVSRRDGRRTISFSAIPNLPPRCLRRMARSAGAWIYADTGDPVTVGNDLLFLHTKTGGDKTIRLPRGRRLRPLIGPIPHGVRAGSPWEARAGQTYGFTVR